MPKGRKDRKRRRRYPVNRVKLDWSYDPTEIAKLFGVHRNTVRHWIKAGLAPLDDRRPILIHGTALRAFLAKRQQGRRHTCAADEFYCFRCRAPRRPWGGTADLVIRTAKLADLTALCITCEGVMHRAIRRADLAMVAELIDIRPMPDGTATAGEQGNGT